MDDFELPLLKELKSGSYESAILSSYNVHFPFFENVVLPALQGQGCGHVVLLMDARQLGQALSDPELAPRHAGRLYLLIPVNVPGVFHPKLTLLFGKRRSRLLVGSHNLTLSGFGLNREVTNLLTIDSQSENRGLAKAGFDYAHECSAMSGVAVAELLNASEQWAPWLSKPMPEPTNIKVLTSTSEGESLWEQLLRVLAGRQVRRVTGIGPYFDNKLEFLRRLESELPGAEITIGIDPAHVELEPIAAEELERIRFVDISDWEATAGAFVHAKILFFELEDGVSIVTSGSANLSAPAWLGEASHRNAELVLARTLSKDDPLPAQLGLLKLHELPEVAELQWREIAERRASPSEPSFGIRAWAATATAHGFEVEASFLLDVQHVCVIGAADELLATVTLDKEQIATGQLSYTGVEARFLTVHTKDDRVRRAVVLQLETLRARATSQKSRDLRQALDGLPSAGLELDSLLSVIEKAIFDDAPSPPRQVSAPGVKTADATNAAGGVGIGDIQRKGKSRRMVSSGDLGIILDTLIRRVNDGLESEDNHGDPVSEEELKELGAQAVERKVFPPAQVRSLTKRCRNKTKRLSRVMCLALGQNNKSVESDPYLVIMRLTATLGLFQQLSVVESRASWVPKGESLLDEEALQNLMVATATHVFAPAGALGERLNEFHGESSELASCRLLGCWLARRLGINVKSLHQEGEKAIRGSFSQLALSLNFFQAEELPSVAEQNLILGADGVLWLQAHLQWSEEVLTAPVMKERISPGSVVRFITKRGPRLSVVDRVDSTKAYMVNRSTGVEIRYQLKALEKVGSV